MDTVGQLEHLETITQASFVVSVTGLVFNVMMASFALRYNQYSYDLLVMYWGIISEAAYKATTSMFARVAVLKYGQCTRRNTKTTVDPEESEINSILTSENHYTESDNLQCNVCRCPEKMVDEQLMDETMVDLEPKNSNMFLVSESCYTEKDELLNNICHLPEEIDEQLMDVTTVDQEASVSSIQSDNCYTEEDNLLDNDCHLHEEMDDERLTQRNKFDETNVVQHKSQISCSSECDLLVGSEEITFNMPIMKEMSMNASAFMKSYIPKLNYISIYTYAWQNRETAVYTLAELHVLLKVQGKGLNDCSINICLKNINLQQAAEYVMWLGNSRCDDVPASRVYAVKGASDTEPVNTTNYSLTPKKAICNESSSNGENVLIEQNKMFSKSQINEQNIYDKLTLEEDVRSELHENETPNFDEEYNKVDCNALCNEELIQDCVNRRVTIPINPAVGDENEYLQFGTTETEYNSDDLSIHDSTKNKHMSGDFTSMPKTYFCGFKLGDNNLESLEDTCIDGENNASYVDTCHQKCHEFDNDFDRFRPICSSPINIIANINDPPDSISSYSSEDTSSMNFSINSDGSASSLTVTYTTQHTEVFIQTGTQNEIVFNGFDDNMTNQHSEEWKDTKDPLDNCDGHFQEASTYEQFHEIHEREASHLSVLQIGNTNCVHEWSGSEGSGKPFCEIVGDTTSDEVDCSVNDSTTKATFLQICRIAENNDPASGNEKHEAKQMVEVTHLDTTNDLVYEVNSGCKIFCVQLGDNNKLTFFIDPLFHYMHTQETGSMPNDVQAIPKLLCPTCSCVCDYKKGVNVCVKEENQT